MFTAFKLIMTENNQHNLTPEKLEEILIELGYSLTDRGKYWHSNAAYRHGDNTTALQIWKNSGVWRDFVQGSQPMPFVKLLELHFGSNDKELFKKYLSIEYINSPSQVYINQDKLSTDKIYPEEILYDLLPHYDFYHKKGVSVSNLKSLKGGLATKGEMYQRFVFPIYNEFGQIHGFSGRDMANRQNAPKWKHLGRKTNWIYPYFVPPSEDFNTTSCIEEHKSVIIVESIGDLLKLRENDYCNALVSFGLDISSKLLCHLISLDLDRIIISFNNDFDKSENRGARAAVKNYLKLLNHFDFENLFICLPTKTDFGEMNSQDFEKWSVKCNSDISTRGKQILDFANDLKKQGEIPKTLHSSIKKLESYV